MKWPIVSRERYEEAMARIADLESERKKYIDVLAYNAIHMTIFNKDLIPQPPVEPEPVLTEEQQAEEARQAIEREENRRLASVMRTNPSRVGPVMTEIIAARSSRAAAAALPPKAVNPNVQALFDKTKSEVTH